MAINTLITIKDALDTFVAGHGQLKSIYWEADDYRAPKITEGDEFPILFVAPIDVQVGRAMNVHTLRVYVYERINDDRLDVIENANDTSLILRDIRVWWGLNGADDIEIVDDPTGTFVSDRELDNLVGYYSDIRFEIPSHGRCDVPVSVNPVPSTSCADATIIIEDSLGNELYNESVPSGGTFTQPISASTAILKDTADNVLSTTPILAEGSEDVIAPDASYLVEYLNGTPIENGNILSGGNAVIVVPNPIACADAVVNVNSVFFDNVASGGTLNIQVRKSTGNDLIGSKQGQYWRIGNSNVRNSNTTYSVNVKATENLVLPDITVTDSDGSSFSQPSVTNVTCTPSPDTTIEVNGVTEGTVAAGSTVNVTLEDSLGTVTPLSVTQVGNDFEVVLPDAAIPTGWVRPIGWLALNAVTTGTENFSGLFAVYENEKNVNTIQITTVGVNTINWGDGTTQSVTSGILYTKVYDYATITSPVLVDDAGLNYKMVVVNINMTGVSQLYIDRNTTSTVIGNSRVLGWLDIAVDCSTMTTFLPSQQGLSTLLQRLLIYNVGTFINGTAAFLQLAALKILKFPFEKLQASTQTFTNNFGDARDENNLPLNINLAINTGSGVNLINNSHLTEVGNITAPFTNSFQSFLFNSVLLEKVGNINIPSVSNTVSAFASCVKLSGIINITSSSILISINGVLNGCFLADGLIISNCSLVTNTLNAVFGCKKLKTLILTGLRVGITVDDCLMEATEINAFFTSLGTASGSQTIFIRRNPGSATCDTTIATGKGFTVTIA